MVLAALAAWPLRAAEDVDKSVIDASPDGTHAILTVRGPEMLAYEEVAIVTQPGGKVVQPLVPKGEHCEDVDAAWSPDSRRLAFYRGDMAGGATEVWDLDDAGGFTRVELPAIDPPFAGDMKKAANEWINEYVKPVKWVTNSKLELKLTGRISYNIGKPDEKVYDYEYDAVAVLDRGAIRIQDLKKIKQTEVPRY